MPAVHSLPAAGGARALRWLFFGSSLGSAALIFHFYRKKRRSRKPIPNHIRDKTGSTCRAAVDSTFVNQLRSLLRVLLPTWRCSSVGHIILITVLLVVRSLCDVWTIYLGTLLESAIITQNRERFKRLLLQFSATMPTMALVNALLKYSTERLQIQFRTRLTTALLQAYMRDLTFYKVSANSTSNIDQLLTADVDRFTSTLTSLYSQLAKPVLDIVIYIWGISTTVGAQVPTYMCAYLACAAVILLRLRAPMGRLTAGEQALEGEFRFCNTRLLLHAEEVAFYGGGRWELGRLLESLGALGHHLAAFADFRFVVNWAENVVAKYMATVVGYFAVSRPFLVGTSLNSLGHQARLETYYKSGRMLVNLAQAIGRLVINAKDVAKLAGYTARIHGLMDELEGFREKHTSSSTALSSTSTVGGRDQDAICFDRVPIVTPGGDVLLKELSLILRPGVNVLICGPNGCGKSSLFRILGGLWKVKGGSLTKPSDGVRGRALFYIPQRPYMPMGTFRDQIIYPDTLHDMHAKGLSDTDLQALLRIVDLDWMVGGGEIARALDEETQALLGQRRTWDDVDNWMDMLSGGQKQRITMARLLYHRPRFAILDECTSAVSMDVEGAIYVHCRTIGITLLTVSHRRSLWVHHDFYLHMDGKGAWEFERITDETQVFGS